jgi:hypothetical protein
VSPVYHGGPEHPARSRADHYAAAGGQPVFSRTLLKQTREWLIRREREQRERERAQQEARTAAEPTKGEA